MYEASHTYDNSFPNTTKEDLIKNPPYENIGYQNRPNKDETAGINSKYLNNNIEQPQFSTWALLNCLYPILRNFRVPIISQYECQGEDENLCTLRFLSFLGGFALVTSSVLSLFDILSLLTGPLLYILHIYQAFFGVIIMILEARRWNYVMETKRWMLHWFRFLTVPVGKGAFYLFVGSLGVALWITNIVVLIIGLYMVVLGLIWVTVNTRSLASEDVEKNQFFDSRLLSPATDQPDQEDLSGNQDLVDFDTIRSPRSSWRNECVQSPENHHWDSSREYDQDQDNHTVCHEVNFTNNYLPNQYQSNRENYAGQPKNSKYKVSSNYNKRGIPCDTMGKLRLPQPINRLKLPSNRLNEYANLTAQQQYYTTSTASSFGNGLQQQQLRTFELSE